MYSFRISSAPRKSDGGRYSIKLASRMSGVSPHTLRMWERRYGYPEPHRTEGGARRYSEDDITTLRLITRALDAGYRAGDVVGQPAQALRSLIAEQAKVEVPETPPSLDAILNAVRNDELRTVAQLLRHAVRAHGPEAFLTKLVHPLAVAIGDAWARGDIAIRQEHAATEILATQLRTLMLTDETPQDAPRVLLTTLPDERHTLALDMVGLFLMVRGATPLSLGASTPLKEIANAAMALDADIVGLSVSASADPVAVERDLRELLLLLPRKVELWIGGAGSPTCAHESIGSRETSSWARIDDELARWRLKVRQTEGPNPTN